MVKFLFNDHNTINNPLDFEQVSNVFLVFSSSELFVSMNCTVPFNIFI